MQLVQGLNLSNPLIVEQASRLSTRSKIVSRVANRVSREKN